MSEPNRSTTIRGFETYDEFTDQQGTRILVRQSAPTTARRVWIFTEGKDAHLTVEQARRVRDALDAFIAENAS